MTAAIQFFFLNASWTCRRMSLSFLDNNFSSSFVRILKGMRTRLF